MSFDRFIRQCKQKGVSHYRINVIYIFVIFLFDNVSIYENTCNQITFFLLLNDFPLNHLSAYYLSQSYTANLKQNRIFYISNKNVFYFSV